MWLENEEEADDGANDDPPHFSHIHNFLELYITC